MNATKTPTPLFIALLISFAGLCGCQSLTATSGQQTASATTTPGKVTVQIRSASKKAKNVEITLTPEMRLQDIVDNAKANFRNKIVYIVRTSPKTGESHKLEASFGSNRRISLETDYAIQPGDRIVIAQDTSSSFDRVMTSLLGRS